MLDGQGDQPFVTNSVYHNVVVDERQRKQRNDAYSAFDKDFVIAIGLEWTGGASAMRRRGPDTQWISTRLPSQGWA